MEIIHVVLGKANPDRMNGVNKVVYQLAKNQAEAGKKVSVWGITKDTVHNYGVRNFETRLFRAKRNPFGIDRDLVRNIVSKKGRAVFHLHGGWIPAFYTLSTIFSDHKIPFVTTQHGAYNSIAMKRSLRIKKLYFNLFERSFLRRAVKIHCIGDSEITGINSVFPTDKTFLQPYGFDPASFAEENVRRDDVNFTIGFVGRLDIYTKGLDLLLDAFQLFHATENRTWLWLIGDGDERPVLEKMIAERNLQGKVILWGRKFSPEKEHLMKQMDVFVHSSRNEGLPASVLEAAALGIPCLVTRATNIADSVTTFDCGVAVEDENPAALLEALITLHNQWKSGRLAQLGNNARVMVREGYNWNRIVNQMDRLYELS